MATILPFTSWEEISEDGAGVAIIVVLALLAGLILSLTILGWAYQPGSKILALLLEMCVRTVLSPTVMPELLL